MWKCRWIQDHSNPFCPQSKNSSIPSTLITFRNSNLTELFKRKPTKNQTFNNKMTENCKLQKLRLKGNRYSEEYRMLSQSNANIRSEIKREMKRWEFDATLALVIRADISWRCGGGGGGGWRGQIIDVNWSLGRASFPNRNNDFSGPGSFNRRGIQSGYPAGGKLSPCV